MGWIKKTSYKGAEIADYWGKYHIEYESARKRTVFKLYSYLNKETSDINPLDYLDMKRYVWDEELTKQECYNLTSEDPFFKDAISDEKEDFTISDTPLKIQTGITSLTIYTGMTSYYSGLTTVIYYSSSKQMIGDVLAYDTDTGQLDVNVRKIVGTNKNPLDKWYIYQIDTPNSITVTGQAILKVDNNIQIEVRNLYYGDIISNDCTFSSNDVNIAIVNSGGTITAISTGSTSVITTHKEIYTGKTMVEVHWPGTYLNITPNPVSGVTGTTAQLTPKTDLDKNVINKIYWTQSLQNIYDLSNAGLLTIIGIGSIELIGTYYGMTGSTTIIGYHQVSSINIDQTGVTTSNTIYNLQVYNQNDNEITSQCNYSSSNIEVATCTNGVINKVSNGTSIITITSIINPNVSETFEITFENVPENTPV